MNTTVTIRTARPEDVGRILEIYAYYIENTAITFEYAVPTLAEFENRIRHTLERYPYLVVEVESSSSDVRQQVDSHKEACFAQAESKVRKIMGYAYAGPLKERAAYDWACELSIYLDREAQKQGLGRMLYEALEARLKEMGILNLYACIACPPTEREADQREDIPQEAWNAYTPQSEISGITRRGNILHEDPYLNWNSVDFHAHLGYRLVGTFYRCGYKFGRWYDMVWMEKMIGEHEDEQLPVRFGLL